MRILTILGAIALTLIPAGAAVVAAGAERIGEVSTNFRWVGSNDKIVVEAFDDPRVPGVACHISHVLTGGINPMAEDGSDASLACRQVGPITVKLEDLKRYDREDAFSASQNLWFKTMHVRRFIDLKRNTLVYLTHSDKLIDGSPKNAISTVPVMPWRD